MTSHTPDFYRMMDEAGLSAAGILSTREPMQRIISRIRNSLAQQMKDYVEKVEAGNTHDLK